jgi:hypothetical protein
VKRSGLSLAVVLLLGAPAASPAIAAQAGPNFPSRVDLPDGFFPEGITGGAGTTVYVGSLIDGSIWRGDVRTGQGSVLVDSPGPQAVGVDYEEATGRVWVAGGGSGTISVHDGATGATLASYSIEGAGFLNDLTVTDDAVYVTDSFVQRLVVVPLGPGGALPTEGAIETRPLSGDIPWVPGEFNANGITAVQGGRWLLVVTSIATDTSQLFRVDPATGATTEVDLGSAQLVDGDGLELRGSTLYCMQSSGEVSVVRLGAGLASGEVVNVLIDPGFDFPTTAALVAGRLWVVSARFGTEPTSDTEYWITQVNPR